MKDLESYKLKKANSNYYSIQEDIRKKHKYDSLNSFIINNYLIIVLK